MTTNDLIFEALSKTPLFKDVNDTFLSKITEQSILSKHKKGKTLFIHEDQAERFYIVQKGWVKLFRETLDGAQAIIDIATKGDVFGKTAIFQDYKYPYSASTIEDTEVISLPLPLLEQEIDKNSTFAKAFIFSMTQEKSKRDKEIEHRSLQNAPQRIGCFLLRLTETKAAGKVVIHLPYDKMFVAAQLGMQAETFSRALKKLRNDTNITVNGAAIEIDDIKTLSDYVCQSCSFEFPCSDIKKKAS